jgi:Zn-dependent peptidase ImmA (M78 family)
MSKISELNTFEMNGRKWKIEEVPQDMFEATEPLQKGEYCFGTCCYESQTIYLWKDLHPEQKRATLMHELLHCYIGCYLSFEDLGNFPEDVVCNICANSHDIIHKIVEDYFKEVE